MAEKKKAVKKSATGGEATRIQIEYYRSAICTPDKHRKVVKGLGFTRLRQIVEREDTPSVRGMVKAIPHLVRIVG
ncbi:MAG: 50S ribosomal protein L30 [Acidobacteriaceae bacterium]